MEVAELTKRLILGGLVYFPSCRERYLGAMRDRAGTLLDSDQPASSYAAIERTIKLFISSDIAVSPIVLMRRFIEDVKKLPPSNTKLINGYLDIIDDLDKKDQFTEQLCANMIQQLSTTLVVNDAVDELKKLRSVPKLQEALSSWSNKLSAINKPGKLRMYNPIQAAPEVLVHRDKVPTGISFLDTLLGGGITWGEHGGLIAPSSGGKSIIANMLLCNIAIQGYNSMLLQFEQSIKFNSDIMSRIYSYLTGMPRAAFADKAYSELTPEAVAALKSCEKVSERIRVASFTDDEVDRNIDTIIQAIDESIEAGFAPKLVIIDWLGAVVSEFLAAATGTDKSYPVIAQEVQDRLNAYAKSRDISLFYLHQSSNEAGAKQPAYKPNMFDSYYFKGFAQKLEYCLEIGVRSKQPDGKFACWLNCDKVRSSEPHKSTIILMDGANAKFDATTDGEYQLNSKGQFVSTQRLLSPVEEDFDTSPSAADSYLAGFG
jgi:hypothetical protein